MSMTLNVHGRKMIISDEEIKSILEKYFSSKPQQGKWFEVNPLDIDQTIFEWKREDPNQERVRQIILDAFTEMKNNPKYCKPFRTTFPERTWQTTTVEQILILADQLGDHVADWVEQALEWAQRIANNESWESLCNEPDESTFFRLVLSKYGDREWIVGGSWLYASHCPATDIGQCKANYYENLKHTVPLVVKYK